MTAGQFEITSEEVIFRGKWKAHARQCDFQTNCGWWCFFLCFCSDISFSISFLETLLLIHAGVLYGSATKNKIIACLTCLASLIRSFLLLQYMQKCIFVDTKFTLLLHCRSVTTINSITVQKICVLSSLDRLIQIKSLRLSIPLKKNYWQGKWPVCSSLFNQSILCEKNCYFRFLHILVESSSPKIIACARFLCYFCKFDMLFQSN